jgi:hypothetical protein
MMWAAKIIKGICLCSLLFLGFIWGVCQLDNCLDGFYPAKAYLHLPIRFLDAVLPTLEQRERARKILDQRFRYVGKGRQFFVFESEDGLYVLKLFKCFRANIANLLASLPLPESFAKRQQERVHTWSDRLEMQLRSCRIAFLELAPETGLLYAHLGQELDIQRKVQLVDAIGFNHELILDDVPFVLQLKAKPAMSLLKELIEQKRFDALKMRLDQLIDLLMRRAKKGFVDQDPGFLERDNLGFIADAAIHIDVGTFVAGDPEQAEEYLQNDFEKLQLLKKLLEDRCPELARYFSRASEQALQDIQ